MSAVAVATPKRATKKPAAFMLAAVSMFAALLAFAYAEGNAEGVALVTFSGVMGAVHLGTERLARVGSAMLGLMLAIALMWLANAAGAGHNDLAMGAIVAAVAFGYWLARWRK
jgi:hypothetical protein